jgi:hypothetical protein
MFSFDSSNGSGSFQAVPEPVLGGKWIFRNAIKAEAEPTGTTALPLPGGFADAVPENPQRQ